MMRGQCCRVSVLFRKTTSVSHTPKNPPANINPSHSAKVRQNGRERRAMDAVGVAATSPKTFKNTTAFVLLFATAHPCAVRYSVVGFRFPPCSRAAAACSLTALHYAPRGQSSMLPCYESVCLKISPPAAPSSALPSIFRRQGQKEG